jgi:uncharacterized protein
MLALMNKGMRMSFVNRVRELEALETVGKTGGLAVVYGRRRIGKTRLLGEWLKGRKGLYTQAIEAVVGIQIEQVMRDIGSELDIRIRPKDWNEVFELVGGSGKAQVLCLDEFPYLVAADPSLPSVLQRWLDHRCPGGFTLVLAGSSTRAMNDQFLNRGTPLYQRARKLIQVEPMDYRAFCTACGLKLEKEESFVCYSLVGGVPKYWEFVERGGSAEQLAEELFFGPSPYLEDEPARILRDEHISGLAPLSVLEAIGRGANKTSEIAARLETAQTNLGRVYQHLLDASILEREIPFGESSRSTKRILYRIADPALRFWFAVYSPQRNRWRRYSSDERRKLLRDHASTVFEDEWRRRWPGAGRYWERSLEIDSIREEDGRLVVSEMKFRRLKKAERMQLAADLCDRWKGSKLGGTRAPVRFEVLDLADLPQLGSER